MRRAVVAWMLVVVLAIGAGAGVVVALNATAFGAAGFVRIYLDALSRGDAAGVLALPGVTVDPGLRDDFLGDGAGPRADREHDGEHPGHHRASHPRHPTNRSRRPGGAKPPV